MAVPPRRVRSLAATLRFWFSSHRTKRCLGCILRPRRLPPRSTSKRSRKLSINTIRTSGHGRGRSGQERPSRHADGAGPGRLYLVERGAALRSGRSALARPRPLCPLVRPCLDVALCHAASGRREAGRAWQGDRRIGRAAGAYPQIPPARFPHAGPSRKPGNQRRRNDDRPARTGRRQLGRHGHRPEVVGQPFQPPRFRAVRLPGLCPLQRRRLDGRRIERSRLDRRPLATVEPVLDLRRQPHHDRRQHRTGLQRRSGHPVYRPGLARRCAWKTPTIWTPSAGPTRNFRPRPASRR